MRRWFMAAVFLLSTAAILFSQDLAEAAKREKERRAAFKEKPVTLLTNDTMSGLRKKPAVSNTPAEPFLPEEETAPPPAEREAADVAPPSTRNVPSVSVIQPRETSRAGPGSSPEGQASEAESRWQKAKEYADLLELKLNSLWLQFYSMDDGKPRELLQQEIAAVVDKCARAREEETKLREEIDRPKDL